MDEVRIDQWSRSELTNVRGSNCPLGPDWPRSELSKEKVRIDQGPNRPRSELSDILIKKAEIRFSISYLVCNTELAKYTTYGNVHWVALYLFWGWHFISRLICGKDNGIRYDDYYSKLNRRSWNILVNSDLLNFRIGPLINSDHG